MITSLTDLRKLSSARLRQRLSPLSTVDASPRPLAWFRIGLASVLLLQAFSLVGHLDELYGRHGLVAWSVTADDLPPGVPNLTWVESVLDVCHLPTDLVVPLTFALYVVGLASLVLGCQTRRAAILAWLAHTALLTSGDISVYGVDRFAQIGLFYCVWFPVGHALSLDHAGRSAQGERSFDAWLGWKVLQVHVCIVYFTSGVEKALGEQWWNGEAVWRAVMGTHDPPFDYAFIALIPGLAVVLGWMTLLLETGAPFFAWSRLTRRLWLPAIVGMHLGIAIAMNLWTFSATMIVFNVAAFGISPHARKSAAQTAGAARDELRPWAKAAANDESLPDSASRQTVTTPSIPRKAEASTF